MREAVESVLEKIRPMLQRDGGDVELVEVTQDKVVKIRLKGACNGCPMAMMTLKGLVEQEIQRALPEVRGVENI